MSLPNVIGPKVRVSINDHVIDRVAENSKGVLKKIAYVSTPIVSYAGGALLKGSIAAAAPGASSVANPLVDIAIPIAVVYVQNSLPSQIDSSVDSTARSFKKSFSSF